MRKTSGRAGAGARKSSWRLHLVKLRQDEQNELLLRFGFRVADHSFQASQNSVVCTFCVTQPPQCRHIRELTLREKPNHRSNSLC